VSRLSRISDSAIGTRVHSNAFDWLGPDKPATLDPRPFIPF